LSYCLSLGDLLTAVHHPIKAPFAAIVLVLIGLGIGTSAQSPLSGVRFTETGPVSIQFENAALGQVLHSLSVASGITILIDSAIDTTQSVNLTFRNAAPTDVLNMVINAANAKVTVINPSVILLQPK